MTYQLRLPDIGEGLVEAEVLSWLVTEGQEIKEDQPLVEIQNDKTMMEIPSPVTGTITKILAPVGTVKVGQVLIEIATAETQPQEKQPAKELTASSAAELAVTASGSPVPQRPYTRALPSIRRYAREKQVDMTTISGSGPGGQITKADVEQAVGAAAQSTSSAEPVPTSSAQLPALTETVQPTSFTGERVKMTPMRKATAHAMVRSHQQLPTVTVFDEIQVDQLVAHREEYRAQAQAEGVSLTYLAYFVKAFVRLFQDFPNLNGHVDLATDEIVLNDGIHIGIATNTARGLFVPLIKHADQLSTFEIAREITRLRAKAEAGQLTAAELQGGSATITNLGGKGAEQGVWATPLINYPESFIIGTSTIFKGVVVTAEDELLVAPLLRVSFVFDHRLVDGVEAAQALNVFKQSLREPGLMLLKA